MPPKLPPLPQWAAMGGEEATSESDLMDDEVTSASGDDCKVPAAVASKTRHAAKPRVSQKASTHTASSSATATQAAKPKSSHATLGETASSSTSAKLKRGRTSKSKVGGQIPTLRHQASNHKYDAECTSESEETSRITQAAARASQWGRKGKQPTPKPKPSECTSDSETYMASAKSATSGSHPITSGAFDYCSWVIKEVLSEAECEKLAKAPFTYMDLCAGMGTSIISVEAVRRALAERGVTLRSTCIALTEKNPRKREALHRRLLHQFGNPPAPDIFKSNAALAAERPVDEVGVLVSQAIADILFQGIVCVNISNLTSTPKSVTDVDGASGESWMSTLTWTSSHLKPGLKLSSWSVWMPWATRGQWTVIGKKAHSKSRMPFESEAMWAIGSKSPRLPSTFHRGAAEFGHYS